MRTTFPAFRSLSFAGCHVTAHVQSSTSWRQVGGISNSTLQCKWPCVFLIANGSTSDKGTSLHVLARSCGPLSCTCVDPPDDADNQICMFSVNNAAHSQVPFRVPQSGPRSGEKKNYAGDKADQHHGGRLLRSRPSARLAAPTDGFDPFL